MNIERLQKIKQHILEEPKRWSFIWFEPTKEAPCGTRACIGGWAQIMAAGIDTHAMQKATANTDDAATYLGLKPAQAIVLFFHWPNRFINEESKLNRAVLLARTLQEQDEFRMKRAQNAAARIDYFIERNGDEPYEDRA